MFCSFYVLVAGAIDLTMGDNVIYYVSMDTDTKLFNVISYFLSAPTTFFIKPLFAIVWLIYQSFLIMFSSI